MSRPEREQPALIAGRLFQNDPHHRELGQAEVPAHSIGRHVRMLSLAQAGAWLAEVDVPVDPGWIFCPRCQPREQEQALCGPRASVAADGLSYRCGSCREEGTHERVVDAVLKRPSAVRRVAAHLAESATGDPR